MAKRRMTKAEREAFLAQWDENNRKVLEVAKKAQAEFDRREQQTDSSS